VDFIFLDTPVKSTALLFCEELNPGETISKEGFTGQAGFTGLTGYSNF
jgi:hypothetical protein